MLSDTSVVTQELLEQKASALLISASGMVSCLVAHQPSQGFLTGLGAVHACTVKTEGG